MSRDINPNPDFSWSNARKEMFEDCKREYYYNYYGAHKGWEQSADYNAWWTYQLKQALPLLVAFADSVQRAIGRFTVLSQEGPKKLEKFTKESFIHIVRSNLHCICKNATKKEDCSDSPKYYRRILESVNYKEGFKSERVRRTIDYINSNIERIADNFFASKTAHELMDGAKVIENLPKFDKGFFEIESKGIKIWGRADTIHVIDGKYVATVWKTGQKKRDDKAEKFLAQVIAVYVIKTYKPKVSNVEVRVCDLYRGETRAYNIASKEEFLGVMSSIGKSIKKMSEYVVAHDVNKNEALPMEMFPQRNDHTYCRYCNYFTMCVYLAKQNKKENPA